MWQYVYMATNTATNTSTTSITFPDGGTWAINGSTITYEGPVAAIAANSPFHFSTEQEATLAWMEVCMK